MGVGGLRTGTASGATGVGVGGAAVIGASRTHRKFRTASTCHSFEVRYGWGSPSPSDSYSSRSVAAFMAWTSVSVRL